MNRAARLILPLILLSGLGGCLNDPFGMKPEPPPRVKVPEPPAQPEASDSEAEPDAAQP